MEEMNFEQDAILSKWINPQYLVPDAVEDIRQAVLAKPIMQYTVLDNFFRDEPFQRLVQAHFSLEFSEEIDRRARDGAWLPYDGAVKFANRESVGGELFFHDPWYRYLAYLVDANLSDNPGTDVKLRYHREYADGFWIHSDGSLRQLVAISYFNRGWKASDGGLLQLWRDDGSWVEGTPEVNASFGRMDFLAEHKRLRTSTPGGGWSTPGPDFRDLSLYDQVVPTYNRIFVCNFQSDPCYHSVTPSNGRIRYGFVQWLRM